jgi:hypothetical protein
MVTKAFVAKVTRIRNSKDKAYFVHRINLPANIVEELQLDKEDYVLLRAEKAQWYHMLDWQQMKTTWNRLPNEIRQKIIDEGLLDTMSLNQPSRREGSNVMGSGNGELQFQTKRNPLVTSG